MRSYRKGRCLALRTITTNTHMHTRKHTLKKVQNTRPLTGMVLTDSNMLLEIKQAHDFLRSFCIYQSEDLHVSGRLAVSIWVVHVWEKVLVFRVFPNQKAEIIKKKKAPSCRRRVLIDIR